LIDVRSPSSGPLKKAIAAFLIAGLAFAAAGCSGGGDEDAIEVRQPPKLVARTVVEGGPPHERALLRRVTGGMGETTLRRIVISALADGEADSGAAVAVRFTPVAGESARRQWEEWIVAGAFSRRLQGAGRPAKVAGSDPSGSFTARPRLPGQPDPRPLSRAREAAVVRGIRRAATRTGGEIVRLEVDRPYGVAVVLLLAVNDPASFLLERLRPLIRRLEVERRRLEGIYLAVLDRPGRLALEWGSWTRNPAGSYWVRRDLAECSPIEQSGPPDAEPPPPCPA
jgi:hypothetical protein